MPLISLWMIREMGFFCKSTVVFTVKSELSWNGIIAPSFKWLFMIGPAVKFTYLPPEEASIISLRFVRLSHLPLGK